jgi:Zn-dependent oligopeptidase
MTQETKTAKQQAEILMSSLLKGKEVYEQFGIIMRNTISISGQPIEHWEKRFKIKVPMDNLSPAMCKQLDMEIMDLNQEAAFYHAISSTRHQSIKRGQDANYIDCYAAIVTDFKNKGMKIPAAATLETMARMNNDGMESAGTLADVETKFWKNILDHLATCRKIIENATINISVELKSLNGVNK